MRQHQHSFLAMLLCSGAMQLGFTGKHDATGLRDRAETTAEVIVEDEGVWCDEFFWRKMQIVSNGGNAVAMPVIKKIETLQALISPAENHAPRWRLEWPTPELAASEVVIYDLAGQPVRHLPQAEQEHEDTATWWDGKNDAGEQVPAGKYWYRVRTETRIYSKMIVVTR